MTRNAKPSGKPEPTGVPAASSLNTARAGLAHACFLEDLDRDDGALDRQALLGAFLVMRLADKLAPGAPATPGDALEYQLRATERHLLDEVQDSPERSHLDSILRAVDTGWRRCRPTLIAPSMLAYAHYLEEQLRLEQAQDVLGTLLLAGGEALGTADRIAATLFVARTHRKVGRFEEADVHYESAESLALAAGDIQSQLLGRIGRAIVKMLRGNLPAAEQVFRAVITDAQRARLRDVEARAHQDLGVVLERRGMIAESVVHALRAYDLHEAPSGKAQALVNVGLLLRRLGAYADARTAFRIVLATPTLQDAHLNARMELMDIASAQRDRIGFESERECVERMRDRLIPSDRVDFLVKCGVGLARFGQLRRAEETLAAALGEAAAYGLHDIEFTIARIKAGLRDCGDKCAAAVAEPQVRTALGAATTALERLAEVGANL